MTVGIGKEPVAVISCRWELGGCTTENLLKFHYCGRGFRQRDRKAPRDQTNSPGTGEGQRLWSPKNQLCHFCITWGKSVM